MEQSYASESSESIALDEEVAKIRSESRCLYQPCSVHGSNSTAVQSLTKNRRVLSASLLSSNAIQNALRSQTLDGPKSKLAPVVLSAEKHAQSNNYRAVFSATSFPFTDPSPHAESPNLLGLRVDICRRGGRYSEPYYVLLKRVNGDRALMRVHKHTIPAFIPLQQIEERYLPLPGATSEDEERHEEGHKKRVPVKQDLQRFVRELRRELVAWYLRRDAVVWLQEELGLGKTQHDRKSPKPDSVAGKMGMVYLSSTSLEARCIRFEWRDGRVGRVSLSNRGLIDRVVVVSDAGRDTAMENLLLRGDRRIEAVAQKLRDGNGAD